jgi:hypothetical protein
MSKPYAIGVTAAAVLLICGLIRPARANVVDCISGPGGTGNPAGCTDADRKRWEELQTQANAEALAEKARVLYCMNNPNAPTDKCPAEDRKIIEEIHAAGMAQQQREYAIWLQGAETRNLEVKAKQEALLKQELDDANKNYRKVSRQRYEDQMQRDAVQLAEQQAVIQRGGDEFSRMISRDDAERGAQRTREQAVDNQIQEQRIAEQRTPPAAAPVRTDPLAPTPTPAQTAESRRAAGLPDDPNAAACIQDADCARAVLPKH